MLATVFAVCIFVAVACGDGDLDAETLCNAYMLKIDGREIGYVSDTEEIEAFVSMVEEAKRAELEAESVEVIRISINSTVDGIPRLCNTESIRSASEIAEIYYANGGKISFSVTVGESQISYISFETVYLNSSAYYEGTTVVKTEGRNGERTLEYEVTYTDGTETERLLVSDTVTKDVVNEEIFVGTKKSTASTGSYAWPLKSITVTSSYGGRYLSGEYNFHLGVDLRASSGTTVYAADGGKIAYAGYMGSYGYLVKILHDNGDYTYYAHLSKINVSVGSRVYKWQSIAKSGATGNVTGPHLHFEIRKNGSTVNPLSYLPSVRSLTLDYNTSPDSCLFDTVVCLSHSEQPAFSSSKSAQAEYPLLRLPLHAQSPYREAKLQADCKRY